MANPDGVGLDPVTLQSIDSIANDAIAKGATPGCIVMVVKDGKIAFNKAYGYTTYNQAQKVNLNHIYDMASVTKICATTLSIMKLYDEGKLELQKTLGDYLPWVNGSNKEKLTIENILLHQAGLISYIPFYKEIIQVDGRARPSLFSTTLSDSFTIPVATNFYMHSSWRDTMYNRILQSSLSPTGQYIYSDNDFIFLGKIVESLTGMPQNEYVQQEFYKPLALTTTTFLPKLKHTLNKIVPTENEPIFRQQQLQGDVHDPGAAMFGGVAGHAGLFSNAYDIAVIMQMLLNGGTFNGKKYLNKSTIDLFTGYHSATSRRGYGFDKPEKDNDKRKEPYPCLSASPFTFGHTGFTGTCTWADPQHNLIYVFLSNRVYPDGGDNKKLLNMNVRPKIHEAIYKALLN